MVELRFAEPADRMKFNCTQCLKARPQVSVGRRCMEPGYNNIAGMSVTKNGTRYTFCPGKATWDVEIAQIFQDCVVAQHTGILPGRGPLEEQSAIFCEVFPYFLELWGRLRYREVWSDVREYVEAVLKQVLGKK